MMNLIPVDLIDEIFSRLPARSRARCCCVSKLWRTILCRPDFTEFFLTRSLARPRLLFAMKGVGRNERFFFSSPQPHSAYEKLSSLVVAADFHMKLPEGTSLRLCGRAFGFFCFRSTSISIKKYEDTMHVICNPSIGKYGFLPTLRSYRPSKSFLGFDPIDKIFKVLSMAYYPDGGDCNILTLGTGNMMWRRIIQCPLAHNPYLRGICINGFLYYLARVSHETVIVCFDVRSEKFKFIYPGFPKPPKTRSPLINYKGKLGVIKYPIKNELCVWVLEDIDKPEWSKYAYTYPDNRFAKRAVFVAGVTATGEIVLSDCCTYESFCVFYFNPERKTLHGVEIQGIDEQMFCKRTRVRTFVNYAEDLTFNMKAHQQQDSFKSLDKFDALGLLDDV